MIRNARAKMINPKTTNTTVVTTTGMSVSIGTIKPTIELIIIFLRASHSARSGTSDNHFAARQAVTAGAYRHRSPNRAWPPRCTAPPRRPQKLCRGFLASDFPSLYQHDCVSGTHQRNLVAVSGTHQRNLVAASVTHQRSWWYLKT